ncbi:MAG: glycosyltransferase [Pseudomonadales bacterium]|nr:glycosyltransferase [Pseudomonadales bacterium]
MKGDKKRLLWWGRFGNYGPDYPRNRTIMQCLKALDWDVIEYQPRISALAHLEAAFYAFENINAVWVPCFRQRDVAAATKWALQRGVPLIFDPLISAYDKQVNERKKFPPGSKAAQKLLRWERDLFAKADFVVADTLCHQDYFVEMLACERERVVVLPVSAEESLFYPEETPQKKIPEVLFFGTFIGLQGAEYIAQAVRYYDGPAINLVFLGDGPERGSVEKLVLAQANKNVSVVFEDWIPFVDLADRIRKVQICLGVFGTGEKSFRVIPNKVYQALACDKPVITMKGGAYPEMSENGSGGIYWCQAGNPQAIADQLKLAVRDYLSGQENQKGARQLYDQYFSNSIISERLEQTLKTF